ncbi:MAG: hypothetical protein JWN44_822 [Myxococcales bacterium]|nr:hypothetical protein [Myxococcales bacterium]
MALLVGLAWAGPAAAQSFPANSAFVALPCGAGVMVDATGDTPNASGPLDLVGTPSLPAGAHAADANFLYLRLRVAGDAMNGANLLPNAWGYEIDLDGNRNTYEVIVSVSGVGATDEVAIYRHPNTQTAGDPAEPAVTPAAFTYPTSTHARVTAAGSTLGGAQDFFIDLALPWSDLATVGLLRSSSARLWAGSSTVPNALDLDLACFGGAGGTLGGIDVGITTPDPQGGGGGAGGGGGGGGVGGSGPRTLEGGPGCDLGAGSSGGGAALFALAVALLGARRRSSR